MTHWHKSLPVVLLSVLFISPSACGQAGPSKADLEAHLTLLTRNLHQGGHFRVKVEIQNISNHVLLIGRGLNLVANMPFRMEIQLEDSDGHQTYPYHGVYVDFFVQADLQLENGLLKWWVPLYPRTFIGTYFTLNLSGIPPGKYRLHGRYLQGRPPHEETALERELLASKVSIFQGAVETNSIQVEVLPKKAD